jgi:hypothetical protein
MSPSIGLPLGGGSIEVVALTASGCKYCRHFTRETSAKPRKFVTGDRVSGLFLKSAGNLEE